MFDSPSASGKDSSSGGVTGIERHIPILHPGGLKGRQQHSTNEHRHHGDQGAQSSIAKRVSGVNFCVALSYSLAWSWTPDSKAVLFLSDRNGTPEMFKQATDQPLAESLMVSAGQLSALRVTPDGSEILYISTPKSASPETPSSIFAIPIHGGTPRLVLKDVRIWNLQCARLPSRLCLYSVTKGKTEETYRFDVKSGKSTDPPQIDPPFNWSLAPDGSQLAVIVLRPNQGTIQLRSTSTGKTRDLVVKGWSGLIGGDWSADGRSLFTTSHSHEGDSTLLNVTLDGRASVLLHSRNEVFSAIPSPDGRSLAITEDTGAKNVWQIENF